MEKYITDERTGLKYELVGDYYFIVGNDVPKRRPIGIWGQRFFLHKSVATLHLWFQELVKAAFMFPII